MRGKSLKTYTSKWRIVRDLTIIYAKRPSIGTNFSNHYARKVLRKTFHRTAASHGFDRCPRKAKSRDATLFDSHK